VVEAAIRVTFATCRRVRGFHRDPTRRWTTTFGKGALLWRIGIPPPIIQLLALFWR
jgi:hypothetical protein